MFEYVHPSRLTKADAKHLLEALEACPADKRFTKEELVECLHYGDWKVFRLRNGLVLVTILQLPETRRLQLLTTWMPKGTLGFNIKTLMKDMQRLAADWECDAVETLCFDVRHAMAIIKLGGEFESVTVSLKVKG